MIKIKKKKNYPIKAKKIKKDSTDNNYDDISNSKLFKKNDIIVQKIKLFIPFIF